MRLVILGAGAIGGVVGAFAARAGRDVLLVARGAHLAAIRDVGLRVETPTETFVVRPAATARPGWQPGDVALLATKTQHAAAALRELGVPQHVPVVCLTNGVEAERLALRHGPAVYACCVMMPATHLEPGVVQAWASPVPGALDLGPYPERASGDPARCAEAERIAAELRAAGFACEMRADIMRWKRGKLLSNLANGAEALCGAAARRSVLMELARREGLACFAAAGLSTISSEEDATRRAGFESRPIAGQQRSGGSTWQSLARGAAILETDYLNGEIALLGREHGVPTPVNDRLQQIAADEARAGAAPGSLSLDVLIERVTAR